MWGVPKLTRTDLLLGDVEPEERHGRLPRHFLVKGLYFARFTEFLAEDFARLRSELSDPPLHGRYVAFRDYPQSDYSRVLCAVAAREYPKMPLPEAIRRIARGEFRAFAESQLGGIMMTMITDLPTALAKLPEVHRVAMRGGEVHTRATSTGFEIDFEDWYGWADCHPIGIVEGVLDHFRVRGDLSVQFRSDSQTRIVVRLR